MVSAYFVLCQKCSCSLSHLGQSHLYTPKLPLVAKTILSYQLEFTIKTFLLKRTSGLLKGLTVCNKATCQQSQHTKDIASNPVVEQRCYSSQAVAASKSKVARARECETGTYNCGSRIREASCSDAYCFIQTGKRLNLAQRDLLTAGG